MIGLMAALSAALAVAAMLAEEQQVGVDGVHRVVQGQPQNAHSIHGQGNGAGRAVLGLLQAHDAARQVHLMASQSRQFRGAHTRL